MAGHPMHYWTFVGLVGAFLDLIIAYFLLCASTCVFFASKFVGLFGFSLPSPCNGLFGIPNCNYSIQTLLADCSLEKVSSVQSTIKSKLPFDSGSIMGRDQNNHVNYNVLKLDRDGNSPSVVEYEGEGSGGSVPDARKELQMVVKRDSVTQKNENGNGKEKKFDMKGKGVMNQRLSGGFRRRRKGGFEGGKLSPIVGNQHKASQLHSEQNGKVDNNYEPVVISSSNNDETEAPRNIKLENSENEERISSSDPESRNKMKRQLLFDDDEDDDKKISVRVLEQALEEEHAARTALYLELEQERSAAASAADEAMAMILRLQEEKATIEMEARQYQRIIEEKSAYDLEEMNILKEILFRRETEKHFLEKEVEGYRQMFYQQSDSEGEIQDMNDIFVSQFDLTEDTDMMLQQINESISNKKMTKTKGASSPSEPNSSLPIEESGEGKEPKEKEIVLVDDNNKRSEAKEQKILDSFMKSSSSSQEEKLAERSVPVVGKRVGIKTVEAGIYIGENSRSLGNHVNDVLKGVENPLNSTSDEEPDVLDIHIVDDETNLGDKLSGNKFNEEAFLVQKNNAERGNPSTSRSDYGTDSNISSSDINIEQVATDYSGRPPVPVLRRNSMTTLDSERSKIDTEVEWLRERLRVVQQGREKLKVSKEYPERERLQLQLLESIACQLREIQQLTEPGKALRQGSLPPASSKVLSKKRRCQSVTIDLEKSS